MAWAEVARMKVLWWLPLLLAWIPFAARPQDHRSFRYERLLAVGVGEKACAVLDEAILAHAAPYLRDLRLSSFWGEVPYILTVSGTGQVEEDAARIFDLREVVGGVGFSLAMPGRAYTEVRLDLAGGDYVGRAAVWGVGGGGERALGEVGVWDLTGRGLGRDTTLRLQESRFPVLRVVLRARAVGRSGLRPSVRGAYVLPSRAGQTVYTTVASTGSVVERAGATVATLRVRARVPVERVAVTVAPGYRGDFSRAVRVTARADGAGSAAETVEGTITRVATKVEGEAIAEERLSFPVGLGANLQRDATVEVAIENGSLGALQIAAVGLEMRERKICFPAAERAMTLFYGSVEGGAPGGARGGAVDAGPAAVATLGAERVNPGFVDPVRGADSAERGRNLWLLGLLGGVTAVAVAVRARGRHPHR